MLKELDRDANNYILLLEIGAEGGSLRLVLEMTNLGIFSYRVIEHSSEHVMFKKEDLPDSKPSFSGSNDYNRPLVIDWNGALDLLDKHRWPWPMFFPLFIHPCIRGRLLTALKERYSQYPYISFSDWESDFADS